MYECINKLLIIKLAGSFTLTMIIFVHENEKDVDEHVKDRHNEMFKSQNKLHHKLMSALDTFLYCDRLTRKNSCNFGKVNNNIYRPLYIDFSNIVEFLTMDYCGEKISTPELTLLLKSH